MTVPTVYPGSPRARATDPIDQSNGTRGNPRIDPMTRYVVDEEGCWLWQGYVDDKGYGRCWTGGAHRHFYTKLVGPIPRGLHLDHVCHDPSICVGGDACKHRRCVNPDHLSPTTPRENVLRSNSFVASNAAATHCPEGHPYEGDNLVVYPKQRTCKTCLSRRWNAAHQRDRERVARRGSLTDPERAVLREITRSGPITDAEVASALGVRRQTITVRRGALARGGLVREVGTRAIVPGTRPAVLWSAA